MCREKKGADLARVYKTFFMLSSTEHEIQIDHKYLDIPDKLKFQVYITKDCNLSYKC